MMNLQSGELVQLGVLICWHTDAEVLSIQLEGPHRGVQAEDPVTPLHKVFPHLVTHCVRIRSARRTGGGVPGLHTVVPDCVAHMPAPLGAPLGRPQARLRGGGQLRHDGPVTLLQVGEGRQLIRGVDGVRAIGGVVGEGVVLDLIKHKVGHNVGDGEAEGRGQVQGHDVCVPVLVADIGPLISSIVLAGQLGPQAECALIEEGPEVCVRMETVLERIRELGARHVQHW